MALDYSSAGYYDVDAGAVFDGVEFYDGISASDLIGAIKGVSVDELCQWF